MGRVGTYLPHETLRASPEVHRRHTMDAAHRAERGARLGRGELAADVVDGVAVERHGGEAALLRAVVHEPVFADVEVARARAAPPLVRPAVRDVVLEAADPRVEVLEHLPGAADGRRDLVVHL